MDTLQQLFKIQQTVNQVSLDLNNSLDSDSSAIKALVELRKASSTIPSDNPLLYSLSNRLSKLADSLQEFYNSKPSSRHSLVWLVTRRFRSHEISRLASEVDAELQPLIDRETLSNFIKFVSAMRRLSEASTISSFDEEKLFDEMSLLQKRLARGFDINLQDLLLKSGILAELEWVLCNRKLSVRIREKAGILMKEVVVFNKDVFVGSFLVGGSVEALVSLGTLSSLQAVSSLIEAIRSPLVDEIESCGGISKIMEYLSCADDLDMIEMAMDCVMKIGYFGRKEAVEAMINDGIVKRLVELQRLEIEMKHPFKRCVARFAVQLEVGEGLRQREKRAFKQQILSKVRESCVSDAESATIVAEVLWGSSP